MGTALFMQSRRWPMQRRSAARTRFCRAAAASSAWRAWRAGGLFPRHRLRHGRHLDRRVALCRAYERSHETSIGACLRMPMLDIRTVAAGAARSAASTACGCASDRNRRARCRGRHATGAASLTVTDCNLVLGRCRRIFPAGVRRAAMKRLTRHRGGEVRPLAERSRARPGSGRRPKRSPKDSSPSRSRTWRGRSSRSPSARHDVTGYTLVAFAGRGTAASLVADRSGFRA